MRSQLNITSRKLLSFYENPLNEPILEEESIHGKHNPRFWHFVFLHFFYCGPMDPENKPVRAGQPLGGNDPRWDILFYQYKALRAQEIVLRLLKMRERVTSSERNMKAA